MLRYTISTIICLAILGSAQPLHAQKVYIGIRGYAEIMEVDVPTGNRRIISVERYPDIIAAYQLVAESTASLLLKTFTAAQFLGIFRLNPVTGQLSGVSGYVDSNSVDPRGSGPDFGPDLVWMGMGDPGSLYLLRLPAGLMRVDAASGDRTVISQSQDPPAGSGFPMTQAIDAVVESPTSVLVMDRFQGIVRIDATDGARSLAHPIAEFLDPPYRIERLPSGELVHCLGEQGSDALFSFNTGTKTDNVLSSGSPARPRGDGVPFVNLVDITISDTGALYAYDMVPPTLFQVDIKTGNRTIVSGGAQNRGTGPELPDGFNRIFLAAGKSEMLKALDAHLVLR